MPIYDPQDYNSLKTVPEPDQNRHHKSKRQPTTLKQGDTNKLNTILIFVTMRQIIDHISCGRYTDKINCGQLGRL